MSWAQDYDIDCSQLGTDIKMAAHESRSLWIGTLLLNGVKARPSSSNCGVRLPDSLPTVDKLGQPFTAPRPDIIPTVSVTITDTGYGVCNY
jgi:hypothetical protein